MGTVANCLPGGGQGHGGVFNDKAAQADTAAHYGEGFIESLGATLEGFRNPHHEEKRQLQQGRQFLPVDAQSDFTLPKEIHERAPGPNAFADPSNGFERFQNIHNTAERQQVYFSTADPNGSYYTMKRHHAPIGKAVRYY